jgi:small multidrug resistance family-3 protein
MNPLTTLTLFLLTAGAEIVGCYLPYLWLRHDKPIWLLLPAALSLGLFAWLLTLHPTGAGRTYAAYGGVYVATALLWIWVVERQSPDRWDVVGVVVSLIGMSIIAFAPRGS